MTIEQLKQYRDLKNEIADLEQRIENAIVMDSVQGSDTEFPHILHSVKLEGVPNDDNTYRVQLLEAKLKCKALFNEINDFINSIEDSQLRRIFRYRFIDERSNLWIALKLGYLDEGTIQRKINKVLQSR